MPIKTILAAVALFSAVALVACGNPEKKDASTPQGQQNATRDEALQEIDIVRKDLVRATHMLQTGRRQPAGEVVSETYVQHYEKVEKVLGSIDKGLNQKLEEDLSTKLRKMIKSGVAVKKIVKFITAVDADLGRAQDKLKE